MTKQERVAVVLAAGKGTRMHSDRPKVLCEANGRPILAYVVDALKLASVDRIILVVGYKANEVREAFAGQPGIEFVVQVKQQGTGHAVMVCREALENHQGPVIVVTGDSPLLQPESLEKLLDEFTRKQAACVLGTLIHDNPVGLGRIVRDDDGNFLAIVEEKDATQQQRLIQEVNMSTYVFDCQPLLNSLASLDNSNSQSEYYVTDVPGIMLKAGLNVAALPVLKPVEALSVNTIEELKQVELELAGNPDRCAN